MDVWKDSKFSDLEYVDHAVLPRQDLDMQYALLGRLNGSINMFGVRFAFSK